jgi:hypothetical protein
LVDLDDLSYQTLCCRDTVEEWTACHGHKQYPLFLLPST